MESKEIIILAASAALLGFSIYRKYFRKKISLPHTRGNSNELTSGRDDDYEPYSSGR